MIAVQEPSGLPLESSQYEWDEAKKVFKTTENDVFINHLNSDGFTAHCRDDNMIQVSDSCVVDVYHNNIIYAQSKNNIYAKNDNEIHACDYNEIHTKKENIITVRSYNSVFARCGNEIYTCRHNVISVDEGNDIYTHYGCLLHVGDNCSVTIFDTGRVVKLPTYAWVRLVDNKDGFVLT